MINKQRVMTCPTCKKDTPLIGPQSVKEMLTCSFCGAIAQRPSGQKRELVLILIAAGLIFFSSVVTIIAFFALFFGSITVEMGALCIVAIIFFGYQILAYSKDLSTLIRIYMSLPIEESKQGEKNECKSDAP